MYIEKTVEDESLGSVLKLKDNTTILGDCENGTLFFYDMGNEQYKITKNNHSGSILALLLIEDTFYLVQKIRQLKYGILVINKRKTIMFG